MREVRNNDLFEYIYLCFLASSWSRLRLDGRGNSAQSKHYT